MGSLFYRVLSGATVKRDDKEGSGGSHTEESIIVSFLDMSDGNYVDSLF